MVSMLSVHVRRGRILRNGHNVALVIFIASALVQFTSAATSPQSAAPPPGSSEFYETLDVDTIDDADEVVGSDGTLRETSPDIHDILELIEDGRIYPVLSKDESQYTPSTSVSKDVEDYSATPEVRNELEKDAANTKFLDYEQNEKKRRKRNDVYVDKPALSKNIKPSAIPEISAIKNSDMTANTNFNVSAITKTDTELNIESNETTQISDSKSQNITKEQDILYSSSKEDNETPIVKKDNPVSKEDTPVPNNTKSLVSGEIYKIKELHAKINESNPKDLKDLERIKRDTPKPDLNKTAKAPVKEKRVKTGDTILNIRGAVKDSIGDSTAGRNAGASVVGAVVIHPSQYLRDSPVPGNHTEYTTKEVRAATSTASSAGGIGERQLLAEHRSRVRLHCDLPANISVSEWVKDGETQDVAPGAGIGRPVWWAEGTSGAAIVGRAGRGEAGEWRCAGYNDQGEKVLGEPVHLTVYEESRPPYLELDGRRLDPGNTWVPVREGVVLEVLCIAEGGVPAPELTWRLISATAGPNSASELRRQLRASPANYTQPGLSSSVARVTVTRALHNASLECDSTQPRPEPRHPRTATARLLIHVTYPPSFVITRWPGFGIALWTGGQAALRCDVDSNPAVRAWWVREVQTGDSPSSSPPPVDAPDAEPHTATLSWGTLTLSHAGWYRCRARWNDQEYSSIGYFLSVHPASERPVSSSESPPSPQNVEVPLGGTVQVHCPKGSVGCWSRRVLGVNGSENWAPAGSARAHGVLGIRGALHQEGGEYRCVGAKAEDEQRLRELKRITLSVVGSATATAIGASPLPGGGWLLSCAVCGRGKRVRWLLEDHIDGGAAVSPGQVTPFARASPLEPDASAPACARAQLELASTGEVWCAVAGTNGGAVAIFPARMSLQQHTPRALATAAAARIHQYSANLLMLIILTRCNVT